MLQNQRKLHLGVNKSDQGGRNFGKTFSTSLNFSKNIPKSNDDSILNRFSLQKKFERDISHLDIPTNKTKVDFYKLMLGLMKKEVEKIEMIKKTKKNKQSEPIKKYRVSLPFPLRSNKKSKLNKNELNYPVSSLYLFNR